MVLNQTQPFHLFLTEMHSTGITLQRPTHEVVVYCFCKGLQVVSIAHFKANNGNQICQLMHSGLSTNLVRFLDGIAIPQAVNGYALRFQLFIEGF